MAFTINLKNLRTIFGKTKTRSQMCLVCTEDGRLVPVEIEARKGCMADDDKISAWLMDPDNQVQDPDTGIWYQLIGERTSVPICPIKQREHFKRKKTIVIDGEKLPESGFDLWDLLKGVFHQSWVADLILLNQKAAEQKRYNTAMIMFGIPVLIAALVIAIKVVKG